MVSITSGHQLLPRGLNLRKRFKRNKQIQILSQSLSKLVTLLYGLDYSEHRNLLEAAAAGASSSIKLVANIAANLIAFLALLAFVNATLGWIGGMVNHPELTFEV